MNNRNNIREDFQKKFGKSSIIKSGSDCDIVWGTPSTGSTGSYVGYPDICEIAADKFVAIYHDSTGEQRARVASLSGTTISWGAEVTVSATVSSFIEDVIKLDTDKFLIVYAVSNLSKVRIGTVSGTTISLGSEFEFHAVNSSNLSICLLSSTKFVISYNNTSVNDGTICVCTISGDTITPGTPVAFTANRVEETCVRKLDTDKIIVFYRDYTDSHKGKAVAATISDTTPTFGTIATFDSGDGYYVSGGVLETDKAVVVYTQNINPRKGQAAIVNVSGTTITFGSMFIFKDGYAMYNDCVIISSTEFVVSFFDNDQGGVGKSVYCLVSGNSIYPRVEDIFLNEIIQNYTRIAIDGAGKIMAVTRQKSPDSLVAIAGTLPGTINRPTLRTEAVSDIVGTEVTANGNIFYVGNGGGSCDKRGFVYDTVSHVDPENTAPDVSDYDYYAEDTGTFSEGVFNKNITGLTKATVYYIRAYAHNSNGYTYGGERSFIAGNEIYLVKTGGYLESSNNCRVARASNGDLYSAYNRYDGVKAWQIYLSKSTDGGKTWSEEQITDKNYAQYCPCVAIDSVGDIHLAWEGLDWFGKGISAKRIVYKKKTGGEWGSEEEVSSETGNQFVPTLALDSDDYPHLVWYWDNSGYKIRYCQKTVGGWQTPEFVTETTNSYDPVIAIDADDNIHVIWRRAGVHYQKKVGASWLGSEETLNANGSMPSLAIDSSGNVHAAYTDTSVGGLIKYRKRTTSWQDEETVRQNPRMQGISRLSICLDASDNIYVIWVGGGLGFFEFTNSLSFRKRTSSAWEDAKSLLSDSYVQDMPEPIWAFHPTVGGVKPNIPLSGFAFSWNRNSTANVSFFRSADLAWGGEAINITVTPSVVSIVSLIQSPVENYDFLFEIASVLGLSFVLKEPTISTGINITVLPDASELTISIQSPSINYDYKISVSALRISISQQAPNINYDYLVALVSALALSTTQKSPTIQIQYDYLIEIASALGISITQPAPDILYGTIVPVDALSLALSQQSPTIKYDYLFAVASALQAILSQHDPSIVLEVSITITPDAQNLVLTIQTATIKYDYIISVQALQTVLSQANPQIKLEPIISPSVLEIAGTILTPTELYDMLVQAGVLTQILTLFDPTLGGVTFINPYSEKDSPYQDKTSPYSSKNVYSKKISPYNNKSSPYEEI